MGAGEVIVQTRDIAATIQQLYVSTGRVYVAVGGEIKDGWIEVVLVCQEIQRGHRE